MLIVFFLLIHFCNGSFAVALTRVLNPLVCAWTRSDRSICDQLLIRSLDQKTRLIPPWCPNNNAAIYWRRILFVVKLIRVANVRSDDFSGVLYEQRRSVSVRRVGALKSTDNLFNPNKCSNGDAKNGCGLFHRADQKWERVCSKCKKRTITDCWTKTTPPNGIYMCVCVQGVSSDARNAGRIW